MVLQRKIVQQWISWVAMTGNAHECWRSFKLGQSATSAFAHVYFHLWFLARWVQDWPTTNSDMLSLYSKKILFELWMIIPFPPLSLWYSSLPWGSETLFQCKEHASWIETGLAGHLVFALGDRVLFSHFEGKQKIRGQPMVWVFLSPTFLAPTWFLCFSRWWELSL